MTTDSSFIRQEVAPSATSGKRVIGSVIRLHVEDNVVIARTDVGLGEMLEGELYRSRSQVPAGYKIAARDISIGEPIRKYNVIIGFASQDILQGAMVHSHNVEFREFDRDYAYARDYKTTEYVSDEKRATFNGIVRADGKLTILMWMAWWHSAMPLVAAWK
jgi:altronate hydrolase